MVGFLSKRGRDGEEPLYIIISQLDPGNHHNPPKPSVPIIVTNQATLRRRALIVQYIRHPELDRRWRIERHWIQDRDTVPTRLDLNGQVTLPALVRDRVVEYHFKWSVFQGGTIDVPRDPVVVEHWMSLQMVVIGQRSSPRWEATSVHTKSLWYM